MRGKKLLFFAAVWTIATAGLLYGRLSLAAESVYGALYNVAHLEAEEAEDSGGQGGNTGDGGEEGLTQGNTESVLMYYPGEEGFIALTTNNDFSEWWVSDELGVNWEIVDPNPMADYNCMQIGRHAVETYNDEVYFGAACEGGAAVFKLTGKDSAELAHFMENEDANGGDQNQQNPQAQVENNQPGNNQPGNEPDDPDNNQDNQQPGDDQNSDDQDQNNQQPDNENGQDTDQGGGNYPTSAVIGDRLFMFYNGGVSIFDGEEWVDTTTLEGQPEGVALEASSEEDGVIYLAFTSGEVMSFDGDVYTTIGENYLEGISADQGNMGGLPSIEVYNGIIYVGNQDPDNGASLFKYLGDSEWEEVINLDPTDQIINKMQLSAKIDGSNYLIFYTANGELGTTIYALDENGEIIQLIDSGLGGENPENNSEVVSIVNRTVDDNGIERKIMLFGTQNRDDQTKIFALMLGSDFAVHATKDVVVSAPNTDTEVKGEEGEGTGEEQKTQSMRRSQKKSKTEKGSAFIIKLKKSEITKGDVYSLWINGTKVDQKTASGKGSLTLTYKKAKKMKVGKSFTVQIGHRLAYGSGDDELLSTNTVLGDSLKVTVAKAKNKKK